MFVCKQCVASTAVLKQNAACVTFAHCMCSQTNTKMIPNGYLMFEDENFIESSVAKLNALRKSGQFCDVRLQVPVLGGDVGVTPCGAVVSLTGRCEILEAHFSEKCMLKKTQRECALMLTFSWRLLIWKFDLDLALTRISFHIVEIKR